MSRNQKTAALEMEPKQAATPGLVTVCQNLALPMKALFNQEDGMEDQKKLRSAVQEVRCQSCGRLLWKDRGAQLEIKEGNRRILLRAKLQDAGTMECSCGFIRPIA